MTLYLTDDNLLHIKFPLQIVNKIEKWEFTKKYMNHMKSSGYIIWKKFWQKNKVNFRKIIFWTQENLFLRENIHSWCELLCTILCMFDLWSLASLYLGHWRPEQSATSSYTSVCVFTKFNSNYMQLLLHLMATFVSGLKPTSNSW